MGNLDKVWVAFLAHPALLFPVGIFANDDGPDPLYVVAVS